MCSVFVRFSHVYKIVGKTAAQIVFDIITVRSLYLVKSVNLAFTHALFQSVYIDVALDWNC